MSPILVTLTSRSDSDFESSNASLKENMSDGVNPNSNDFDYYVRRNEGKIIWFSADCVKKTKQCCEYKTGFTSLYGKYDAEYERRSLKIIKILAILVAFFLSNHLLMPFLQ